MKEGVALLIPEEDVLEILKVAIPLAVLVAFDRVLAKKLYSLSDELKVSPESMRSFLTLVRIVLIGVLMVSVLSLKWIPTEYFVGGSVIISTIVAFAVSKFVINLASGAYALFTKAIKVGDYVNIGGQEGVVIDMDVNHTRIRRDDGIVITIPNKDVMEKVIINYSPGDIYICPLEAKLDAREIPSLPKVSEELSRRLGVEVSYYVKSLAKNDAVVSFIVRTDEIDKMLEAKKRFYEELYSQLSQSR